MIKQTSQNDVAGTLDRLENILKEKGITVLARVDHAAAAKKVDMELRPTQVLLFGSPKLGTPLMQTQQTAGLDLPMKVLAWEDETGQTWIGYHPPQLIAEMHDITDRDDVINKLAGALENMVDAARQSSS